MLDKAPKDNEMELKRGKEKQLDNKQGPRAKKKISKYEPGLEMLRLKARGFVLEKPATLSSSSELRSEAAPDVGQLTHHNVPTLQGNKRKASTAGSENPNKKLLKTEKHCSKKKKVARANEAETDGAADGRKSKQASKRKSSLGSQRTGSKPPKT